MWPRGVWTLAVASLGITLILSGYFYDSICSLYLYGSETTLPGDIYMLNQASPCIQSKANSITYIGAVISTVEPLVANHNYSLPE